MRKTNQSIQAVWSAHLLFNLKTLIAEFVMRIIQIEPRLCNWACWMCPYRVANPWIYVFSWRGFFVYIKPLYSHMLVIGRVWKQHNDEYMYVIVLIKL